MSRKEVVAVILAAIGIVASFIGGFQYWQIHHQNVQEKILTEELRAIHDGSGYDAKGIDQGLLKLNKKNPDCIYWLKIPKTKIDYPVMYRPQDKDYYLTRNYKKKYAPSGALYISEKCDPEHGDNLIIYGHHMSNGTMFAHLEDYKDEKFYRKHKRIVLETLHGREEYQIMAAFTTPVYTGHDFEYYEFTTTEDPGEYAEFVSQVKERSIYDTGISAVYGQRLLTLSTCEYSQKNGRMVIVAVRKQDERNAMRNAVRNAEREDDGRDR